MAEPTPNRPPTTAEAFFRTGFGCLGGLVLRIAAVVVIVLVADWRAREKYARREAERAATSETAVRLADEFAKETDSDGRFVRTPEGELSETDVWGRPFRLAYKPGVFHDELEVRSAGPNGVWNTWDDIVIKHRSKISTKALARERAAVYSTPRRTDSAARRLAVPRRSNLPSDQNATPTPSAIFSTRSRATLAAWSGFSWHVYNSIVTQPS